VQPIKGLNELSVHSIFEFLAIENLFYTLVVDNWPFESPA